ncbi:hypothetical protein [Microbacterium kyungheense]|uniref:Uncharacterized protein n=1 Tax=Microbacterium kyungheense TaxID=1263636 RepID=A0A543F160_9MICO|nr:hypothetical protein [Microbacterium kyungheense]TQM27562.1 hypothetical protein FB391_1585 [Microbacterium kyungheense]
MKHQPPTAEQVRDSQLAKDAVVRAAFAKHEPWPEHALARLAEGSAITTQRFAQVVDLCAATPGEDHRYSTEELAEKTGMNVNEWRSACRKIRLHLEKHHPEIPRTDAGNPEWPLVDMSGRTLGERDQLYVGITEEQARRWRTVRCLASAPQYASLDTALRNKHVPVANDRFIKDMLHAVGVEGAYQTTGYIVVVRAGVGPDLNTYRGATNGFVSKEEVIAVAGEGPRREPSDQTGLWRVVHPEDPGGRESGPTSSRTSPRDYGQCPECFSPMTPSGFFTGVGCEHAG